MSEFLSYSAAVPVAFPPQGPGNPQPQDGACRPPAAGGMWRLRAKLPMVPSHLIQPPAINLPKGGGAIRGMGEKFAANPVTGTGSMTVPIATSPGRSGFGPELSLSYDSGAGNGPFGFGWSLSLPAITRKTDKGLPRYRDWSSDPADADVFVLSGAEDLVPVFRLGADGSIVTDASGQPQIHEDTIDGYRVRRYRPRIEGLFRPHRALAMDPHRMPTRVPKPNNGPTCTGARSPRTTS